MRPGACYGCAFIGGSSLSRRNPITSSTAAHRVVVIGCSSKLDRMWQDVTREAFDRYTQLEKTYLFDLSFDAMLSEVSKLSRDTIVVVLTAYAHLMRVSVLGELSGAIAHEINQPLTAIMSNAHAALEFLKQDSPDLREVREALKEIATEDGRAGKIIQRLRALMKKGEIRFEPIDLNQSVEATMNHLRSELIARGVRVDTDLARDLPWISGGLVQLQQVLMNLIVNSIDAMANTALNSRVITLSTASLSGGITDRVFPPRPETVCSTPSTRPRTTAWVSGCRYARPSSRLMVGN